MCSQIQVFQLKQIIIIIKKPKCPLHSEFGINFYLKGNVVYLCPFGNTFTWGDFKMHFRNLNYDLQHAVA